MSRTATTTIIQAKPTWATLLEREQSGCPASLQLKDKDRKLEEGRPQIVKECDFINFYQIHAK